jgi:tripartite ATP-independent transporter DctP family solute receptor
MRKILVAVVVIIIAAGGGVAAARAQAPVKMRLGHDLAPTHPWHVAALRFAEDIKAKSKGTIELAIFPSSQLGDLRELMELTQRGTLDMNVNTSGILATFVPDANIFNLPFLFSDSTQADEFYGSKAAETIKSSCEKARIKCLAFMTTVFRSPMNSKRPIRGLEDVKGLKIRLMQVPIHIETYRAMGAAPTALPFSELYTAAQTGVVDGFENAIGTLYTSKLYEVGKYLDTLPVFLYTNVLAMSQRNYEKLSVMQQQAIVDSVPQFVASVNKAMLEFETSGLEAMKKHGVTASTGPFDLKGFRKAVEPVYAKYLPTLSKDIQQVVRELQKAW